VIYIHGLTNENKSIVVKVIDFKPWAYVELDPKITWTNGKVELLYSHLRQILHDNFPIKKEFVERQKIYFLQTAKFIYMEFNTDSQIQEVERALRFPINIFGLGNNIKLTMHEGREDIIFKFFAKKNLRPSTWLNVTSSLEENDQYSTSNIEITCSWKDISIESSYTDKICNPKILSFDIECISPDKSGMTFPDPKKAGNQVITISATVGYHNDPEDKWKTYCLVNGENDMKCPEDIEGCIVKNYNSERELLIGYAEFVSEIDPDIIVSYNGLSFDDNYLIERSVFKGCWPKFSTMGRIIGRKNTVEERKWSSSAYGDQCFKYMEIHGRLHIDMYAVIFKDFTTLESYKLDYVSEKFLGENKIDLPAREMIQLYHQGGSENMKKIVKYCNQDTKLPFKLLKKMNSVIGLVENSNIMRVPIFDLITRGQQIRVFSQIYCNIYSKNIVCCKKWNDYNPTEEEKEFVGATVQDPRVGLWNNVATYDFKSLYPTTIIAYNLCCSTFIPDNNHINIKPEDYHTITVNSHYGCEHDNAIRKSKISKKICKDDVYRFYKSNIKKGIVPELLENLLDERTRIKKLIKEYQKRAAPATEEEIFELKQRLIILDKRQNGVKIAANSVYGGFGSDYSKLPFYPAAASTTAMGRYSIKQAIDYVITNNPDAILVYGDTDSCMFHFKNCKTIEECFHKCEELEVNINKIFPPPMYLELEKIYKKYFLLSKKRYIGYIMNKSGEIIEKDKKGVVIKRRDNCELLRIIYEKIISMVMNESPKWMIYDYLRISVNKLLTGDLDIKQLVITKSIKDNYKAQNLPHIVVANKMKSRGKYVVSGTRIQYIFVKTDQKNAPQYMKAEDPDYYLECNGTLSLDYEYYLEKQLVTPIDEVLEVKYKIVNVMKNLHSLLKKGLIKTADDYFTPKFIISE
jgi:DNA polymerase delta subunit 1